MNRSGASKKDEVDFFELASGIWQRKSWVAGVTAFFMICGWAYIHIATPMYRAEAVIAPKETQGSASQTSILSQFGGLGGLVSGQMGFNTNLDRLEIIAGSRDVAEMVIRENDLLPVMYGKDWDDTKSDWRLGRKPQLKAGVGLVRGRFLKLEMDHMKKVLVVAAETPDPTLSERVVRGYLMALNKKIYTDVRLEADSNTRFLETQLANTADPLLREKIQNMIAFEIEKAMLVSNKTFDVLESPIVPDGAFKPNRRGVFVISFALGLLLSVIGVLIFAFLATPQSVVTKGVS